MVQILLVAAKLRHVAVCVIENEVCLLVKKIANKLTADAKHSSFGS